MQQSNLPVPHDMLLGNARSCTTPWAAAGWCCLYGSHTVLRALLLLLPQPLLPMPSLLLNCKRQCCVYGMVRW